MTFCWFYSIQQAAFLKCQVKGADQQALWRWYLCICYLHLIIFKVENQWHVKHLGSSIHYLQNTFLSCSGLQGAGCIEQEAEYTLADLIVTLGIPTKIIWCSAFLYNWPSQRKSAVCSHYFTNQNLTWHRKRTFETISEQTVVLIWQVKMMALITVDIQSFKNMPLMVCHPAIPNCVLLYLLELSKTYCIL